MTNTPESNQDEPETPEADVVVDETTPEESAIPRDSAFPDWLVALPDQFRPYAALSRLDRPVGIWLLALPCLIGLLFTRVITGLAWIDLAWAIVFILGAVVMRGAGCTWNDIQDRDIDSGVERTATRPLPSGQVTLFQAGVWLGIQLTIGFLIWLTLPIDAKIIALFAIPLVAAYPFMKRITWWPQAWLGATFNWGVFVAAATAASVSLSTVVLWLGLACWTVAYDTIYALQDAEDDALIGVKSTARLFGERTLLGAFCFFLASGALIALAFLAIGAPRIGAITVLGFYAHALWQIRALSGDRLGQALAVFKSNVWTGVGLLVGCFVAAALA